MNRMNDTAPWIARALAASLAIGATAFIVAATGCKEKGAAEKAGEKIDDAADEAGDAIEDAADEVEDVVDGN